MFSVVIMSKRNGGKSQKQSGIALRRLRMRLLSVIENFSPPTTFWNTRDITVNGVGVLHIISSSWNGSSDGKYFNESIAIRSFYIHDIYVYDVMMVI